MIGRVGGVSIVEILGLRRGSAEHAAEGELCKAAAAGGTREGVVAVDLPADHEGVLLAEEGEEFVPSRALPGVGKIHAKSRGLRRHDRRMHDDEQVRGGAPRDERFEPV
ncbi:MAG: hypothetical protein ABIQ12_15270 [Opitutaceae bacterium]